MLSAAALRSVEQFDGWWKEKNLDWTGLGIASAESNWETPRKFCPDSWCHRAERIWENTEMGIDFTWVPKFQGNSSVPNIRIRRLSVWRYMCCSTSILRVCNLMRLLQFLCYKSVARKRIVKTSGNRLRRLVWSDCKLCKSAIINCSYDWWISNKPIRQSKPTLLVTNTRDNNYSIIACVFVAVGTCLQSCCLAKCCSNPLQYRIFDYYSVFQLTRREFLSTEKRMGYFTKINSIG
jgi:hypothetical protein